MLSGSGLAVGRRSHFPHTLTSHRSPQDNRSSQYRVHLSCQFTVLKMSAEAKVGSRSDKVVVKVDVHDDKDKKKAMKAVSSLQGIDSISMDMKDMKLTVIGIVDPTAVVDKLRRKHWCATIDSVGPAKEPEKKKEEPNKGEEEKKKVLNEQIAELAKAYKAYNPCMTSYYCVQSAEENPNACVVM
ncbi:hypothetical protein B296_00002799 [Ensete ventricosum]|uniref:HMA domain-containing protein n=1 Tax=Ensete ventricosum TaxID=4639 RepID=A0A426YNK1_ENSVE|nr:hypothetical protein B296_00002799 [Ensete ventricosum]